MSPDLPDMIGSLHRYNDPAVHDGKDTNAATNGAGNKGGISAEGVTKEGTKGETKGTKGETKNIAKELLNTISEACDIVHSGGQFYAVGKPGAWGEKVFRPVGVAQEFGAQFRRRIVLLAQQMYDAMIGADLADKVMLHLEAHASDEPEAKLALRFHHPDPTGPNERIYIDLAREGGQCIEITAAGWKVVPQPPRGVIFTRSHKSRPLPLPVAGGQLTDLARVLALPEDSPEFRLILGWTLTLPLSANTQPALLLIGAPGYGKSTRLRLAVSVWEPSDEHSLGSGFGRDAEDDIVRARHRAVPIWDNLTSVSGATSDHFCTMVTGTGIEGRKYHTNADFVSYPIARPIGLTAVGMPPGFRPDALDRLVVVELPEITQRVSDATVQAEFNHAHPQLLDD